MENTNNGGFPNVNDIKIEDTPAESFQNLYGNGANNSTPQPMPNQMNGGVQPQPMPNVNAPVQPTQMTQPTMEPSTQPSIQPQINPMSQNVQPAFTPMQNEAQLNVQTPQFEAQPVTPQQINPQTMNNGMQQNINTPVMPQQEIPVQPSIQPQMNPQQPVPNNAIIEEVNTPTNGINVTPQPVQTPNPGVIMTPNNDLSNIDIDKERMQSIEEQLSKTSQYNPEDLQPEKITIPTDNQDEKNKSGLTFVIILFVILGVVIALLPQITKWLS